MNVLSPDTLLHVLIALAVLVLPGTAVYRLVLRILTGEADDEPMLGWIAGAALSIALWPLILLYFPDLGYWLMVLCLLLLATGTKRDQEHT